MHEILQRQPGPRGKQQRCQRTRNTHRIEKVSKRLIGTEGVHCNQENIDAADSPAASCQMRSGRSAYTARQRSAKPQSPCAIPTARCHQGCGNAGRKAAWLPQTDKARRYVPCHSGKIPVRTELFQMYKKSESTQTPLSNKSDLLNSPLMLRFAGRGRSMGSTLCSPPVYLLLSFSRPYLISQSFLLRST